MANISPEVKKAMTPASGSRVSPPAGDAWHAMRHEMERLFDRFSHFDVSPFRRLSDIEHFWPRTSESTILSVNVDVAEDDKAYTITAELPGLEEKDIDVSVTDDLLTLKGEKRAEMEEKNKNHYVCERSFGAFQRSFALPADAQTDKIDAKFSKGILTITLPKNPKAQPASKKIQVKAA